MPATMLFSDYSHFIKRAVGRKRDERELKKISLGREV